MKKKLLSLTLCLVFILVSASPAFAAVTAASTGFYDIGTAAGVTITPYAGETAVTATSVDVDGDNVNETYYPNSDRFVVTMTGAASGKEYTFTLYGGNGVPSDQSNYYDIRQVAADSSTINVTMIPKLPEANAVFTLYINSNAPGFVAKSINLNYAHVAEMGDKPSFNGAPVVTVSGNIAQVAYSANNGDAEITGYKIILNDGSKLDERDVPSNQYKYVFTGLTNGTTYTVTVVATNAYGSTESEAVTFTAGNKPTFSSVPTVVVGNGTATISFSAADNGIAITSYQIKLGDTVVATLDANATSYTFEGLSNGTTYSATVVATNAVGSTESKSVSFTPIDPTSGATVSGTVTSYLDEAGIVTIGLYKDGSETADREITVTGNTATYSIPTVAAGKYTMKVSKTNHITREYAVEVGSSAITQNVQIHAKGDLNGDGEATNIDVNNANLHYWQKKIISGYTFKCADVNNSNEVDNIDVNRINLHYWQKSLLW